MTIKRAGTSRSEKVPDIRITDEVLKRMIAAEQRRIGDPNATKTAGRIIERYFAVQGAAGATEHAAGALADHPV